MSKLIRKSLKVGLFIVVGIVIFIAIYNQPYIPHQFESMRLFFY